MQAYQSPNSVTSVVWAMKISCQNPALVTYRLQVTTYRLPLKHDLGKLELEEMCPVWMSSEGLCVEQPEQVRGATSSNLSLQPNIKEFRQRSLRK